MSNIRFIAETAFSHEGNASYLFKLVDEILEGKAEIVKFQILLQPEYMPDHPMALKCRDLMLQKTEWRALFDRVRKAGKQVLVLPVDIEALRWVVSENLADILEIHSVNLFRKDFYDFFVEARPDAEVILSISGYKLESIDFVVTKYQEIEGLTISLMFGFQAFPTDPGKLGLNRIAMLRERYNVDVGYADHTSWSVDSSGLLSAAIALGSTTIEKHVVLEPGKERIDYNSAVGSGELDNLIFQAETIKSALGSRSDYPIDEAEWIYGARRLKLISEECLSEGEFLKPPKVFYRWTTTDSGAGEVASFESYGKRSQANLGKGELIA